MGKPEPKYLGGKSRMVLIVAELAVVVFIGLLDHITGPEIGFSLFYLFPIVAVCWFVGRWHGTLMSAVSAATWLIADLTSGHSYTHPFIPYWNMTVRLGFFLIINFALSGLKSAHVREKMLARTDSLTGASNPLFFNEICAIELERFRRYGRPLTLAYIDLDNFKTVNDTFGHSTGSRVLGIVARVMMSNARATDTVARLGGDEFTILMPETGLDFAKAVVERIQSAILETMRENQWPVTCSIGLVTFYSPPFSVDTMISMADNLMYSVKNSGKNGIRCESLDERADEV